MYRLQSYYFLAFHTIIHPFLRAVLAGVKNIYGIMIHILNNLDIFAA